MFFKNSFSSKAQPNNSKPIRGNIKKIIKKEKITEYHNKIILFDRIAKGQNP